MIIFPCLLQMKRSKKVVPEELKNPWIVENLEEFLYYCCPECDVKSKDTQSFIEHALINHAQAQHLVVVKLEDETEEPLNIDGTVVHLIDATEPEPETEDLLEPPKLEQGKYFLKSQCSEFTIFNLLQNQSKKKSSPKRLTSQNYNVTSVENSTPAPQK